MALLIVFGAGLLVGFLVGRWWALAAPVGLGIWAASGSELEVPSWYIGLVYSVAAAAGVVAGVLLRRLGRRRAAGP